MEPETTEKTTPAAEPAASPSDLPDAAEREVCWQETFTLSGGCCGG